MNTYYTSDVAALIGIHPNTVRLYEKLELIPQAKRQDNGYRIFTDFHIEQLRIARAAFQVEILQNGLRKQAIQIIKTSATGDFDKALLLTDNYLKQLKKEKENAEKAILIVEDLLSGKKSTKTFLLKRKEVSDLLGITMDSLRNWEMNGLLHIKRKANGYRVYSSDDIRYLHIIRALRCANYSLSSILRMLNTLSIDPHIDIKDVIGKPQDNEDIVTACDQLLYSLESATQNALYIQQTLITMKKTYSTNPPL